MAVKRRTDPPGFCASDVADLVCVCEIHLVCGTASSRSARPPCRYMCVCVCVCVVYFPFILDVRLVDIPVGVTQEEGLTGFLIHPPSAVLASIFLARRIQAFLSLVYREVEFCVLTI